MPLVGKPWRFHGPFPVGALDCEWLGAPVDDVDDVDPAGHLAARIFYPAATPAAAARKAAEPWLGDRRYAQGLAGFVFFRRPRGALFWLAKHAVALVALAVGRLQRVALLPGAPLAAAGASLPVVVFSHGLGGSRSLYSLICGELASHGYVVLAIEHADGTACAAKLAGGHGWRYYLGLGGEDGQVAKTRHRVAEARTAVRVLRALGGDAAATPLPGRLALSHGADAAAFFAGALDLECLAAVGHSYGGATVAEAAASEPAFASAVALDPWWDALPLEAAALRPWTTPAPLLVCPSHDWSEPNVQGEVMAGPARQAAVLDAARARGRGGRGAARLIIAGSSHNSFADALPLFSERVGALFRALGLTARLDPVLGIAAANLAILHWLDATLPLAPTQRALGGWAAPGSALRERVAALAAADAGGGGAAGARGPVTAVSDALVDHVLRTAAKTDGVPADVVTGAEALESAAPSAAPAAGARPHAPDLPAGGAGARARPASPPPPRPEGAAAAFVELLGERLVWRAEVYE